jgi:hypothetical protein
MDIIDKPPTIAIELFVYVFGIKKIHFGTMLEVCQQPKKQHA